jgi:broad specificity phosphatase PhoE
MGFMKEILFIRHAETDMAKTFCGHSDPPVNQVGYTQIERLVMSMQGMPISAIFTSDLQRASRTAATLARSLSVRLTTRTALREINFGVWEGLTWKQVETLNPALAARWLDAFPHCTPPLGESFESFEARIMGEVSYLLKQPDDRLTAVVTHAGVMRVVLRNLCGIDEKATWAITKPYCCAFKYVPDAHDGMFLREVLG